MAEATRLERLALGLRERELDALVVEGAANLRYLTGFTGSSGLALVDVDGAHRFLTDFRYEAQAGAQLVDGLAAEIIAVDLLAALGGSLGPGRVGFDEAHTTVGRWNRLRDVVGDGVELLAAGGLVERLRARKDAGELAAIAAAAGVVDDVYRWIVERGLVGRTERSVALELEHEMRLRGAEGPSFSSIVASGAHGALPHAQPRDTAIDTGSLVTIDIGAVVDGYCSDCTRTFAVGEPSARAREMYTLVLAAQRAGLGALACGRSGFEVDAAAREVIVAAGYGEHFGHGLGHGVGLEIHEAPRLSKASTEVVLEAGNVVTVEPGVYLPGELGVRIEDLVALGDAGVTVLSTFTKELLVVD